MEAGKLNKKLCLSAYPQAFAYNAQVGRWVAARGLCQVTFVVH